MKKFLAVVALAVAGLFGVSGAAVQAAPTQAADVVQAAPVQDFCC